MRKPEGFFMEFIRYHSKFTFVTWICLAFVLSGLVCVTIAAGMFRIEWLYRTGARKTAGVVISKFRASSGGSFGGTASSRGFSVGGTDFVVHYGYRAANGRSLEDSDTVSQRYWTRLQPGNPLDVFYLAERDGHSRLWLGMRAFDPTLFFLVGAMVSLVGGGAAVMAVADQRSRKSKRRKAAAARRNASLTS